MMAAAVVLRRTRDGKPGRSPIRLEIRRRARLPSSKDGPIAFVTEVRIGERRALLLPR